MKLPIYERNPITNEIFVHYYWVEGNKIRRTEREPIGYHRMS